MPTVELLNLPELQPTPTVRGREERLSLTGDQRIDDQPEFIHQPGINQARRRARAQ